jgi:hypothetical protein
MTTYHRTQRICAADCDWLTGRQLSDDETACDCFESDPYPKDTFPVKVNRNRRLFLYHEIAKELGVKKRVKLPGCAGCVEQRIRELYPDETGYPTKVGFKRARAA